MNRRAKDRQQRGEDITDYEFVDAAAPAPDAAPAPNPDAWRSRTTPLAGERAYVVEEAHEGLRLDRYLAQQAEIAGEALSRTRLQGLIEEGKVLVNGVIAKDGKNKVRTGFAITIDVPQAAPAEPMGENIPLNVIYEDDELIVIDKPAGLVVHPASGHETGTLVNALIAHCGESLSGIGGVKRPGIVHRIDKDTSGLLVIAKTDAAHQGLAALFADHGLTLPLEREYRAIVWGVPSRARGMVDAPLGRHATHREKQAVVTPDRGRNAVTHWELQERFLGKEGAPAAALLTCRLETGRTHQIRVHMAHIAHPLLGDPVYGTGFRTKSANLTEPAREALAALGRQALHAARLGFEHPVTGVWMEFESEPPEDMQKLLAALRG
jgi:23S rRNA pseudouridine1911/1915/1917 synthase